MVPSPVSPRRPFRRLRARIVHSVLVLSVAMTAAGAVVVGGPVDTSGPTVRGRSVAVDAADLAGAAGKTVELGFGAEMLGATWEGDSNAALDVRSWRDGRWTPWERLEADAADAPDTDSPEWSGRIAAGPLWLGHDVGTVQVRRTTGSPSISNLSLEAIDSEPAHTAGLGVSAAGASLTQPGIIPRAAWGADESWRNAAPGCEDYPHYAKRVRYAYVHHTATSNVYAPSDSPAIVRGIYYFHTHTQMWCDIAYNFLIDRYGQIFEGRYGGITTTLIGGHASGYNTGSTGISVIGNFEEAPVPSAAYDALRRLLTWKLAYHGIDPAATITVVVGANTSSRYPEGSEVVVPTIVGHTDTNYTSCPGAYLYALLPQLRMEVKAALPAVDTSFGYGNANDVPLVGDWNGDGVATPGVYRNGWFYLRNSLSAGVADISFPFGDIGDRPVVGDWNGDGVDTVGVFRHGQWYLRNANSAGVPAMVTTFGVSGDVPVVGDWNGNGVDTIGVFRPTTTTWYLTDTFTGPSSVITQYGAAGDTPLVGDWDGDGRDSLGVVRAGRFLLHNGTGPGVADIAYTLGTKAGVPVAGDYDGDGVTTVGFANGGAWSLDRS